MSINPPKPPPSLPPVDVSDLAGDDEDTLRPDATPPLATATSTLRAPPPSVTFELPALSPSSVVLHWDGDRETLQIGKLRGHESTVLFARADLVGLVRVLSMLLTEEELAEISTTTGIRRKE